MKRNMYRSIELFITKLAGHSVFIIDEPMNSFKEVEKEFPERDHITKDMWPLKSVRGTKIIEIISCEGGDYNSVMREIRNRGYEPAPAQHFVKIGLRNRRQLEKHEHIYCLDEKFIGKDRILSLDLVVKENKGCLDGMPISFIGRYGTGWYAVVKKLRKIVN